MYTVQQLQAEEHACLTLAGIMLNFSNIAWVNNIFPVTVLSHTSHSRSLSV